MVGPAWAAGPGRRRRLSMFDALGLLALVAFAATLWISRVGLSQPDDEVGLTLDPAALAEGFREGVSWHGLYRDGDKVGFSKTARRRLTDGYATESTVVLPVPGLSGRQTIQMRTELDEAFALRSFTASLSGGPMPIAAEGSWTGSGLAVSLTGLPGGPQTSELSMPEPPQMDQSYLPIVTREDVAPGDRFRFTHFDPLSASPTTAVVTVVGRETLDVLGDQTEALHLRQQLAGEVLDVWVNDLGEVLRQTLPGGLISIRESEAEATWGMAR